MSGVAIVTGAGSGIGRASSRRLQEDGMTVIALDVDVKAAAEVSPNALAMDVSDAVQVSEVMTEVLLRWPRIDVLVNNAGITGSAQATTAHETPIEEFDRVIGVNVRGPFLCSRAVLPSMIEAGRGHIITIASAAGIVAFPGRCAYTTSKGAALQLARSMAVDYGRLGIRSNAICPGMAETPMTQWRLDQPELRDRTESQIPMGRVASPEEIADVVSVLASGRMGYANGAALVIDGGWTAW
ncbi:MAG: SDR family oxidoreductase [Candidatus Nanopelagicales bacterium]|nr:SDR family oxidoreductase [Candidatus Nanopelagicales bacterium]